MPRPLPMRPLAALPVLLAACAHPAPPAPAPSTPAAALLHPGAQYDPAAVQEDWLAARLDGAPAGWLHRTIAPAEADRAGRGAGDRAGKPGSADRESTAAVYRVDTHRDLTLGRRRVVSDLTLWLGPDLSVQRLVRVREVRMAGRPAERRRTERRFAGGAAAGSGPPLLHPDALPLFAQYADAPGRYRVTLLGDGPGARETATLTVRAGAGGRTLRVAAGGRTTRWQFAAGGGLRRIDDGRLAWLAGTPDEVRPPNWPESDPRAAAMVYVRVLSGEQDVGRLDAVIDWAALQSEWGNATLLTEREFARVVKQSLRRSAGTFSPRQADVAARTLRVEQDGDVAVVTFLEAADRPFRLRRHGEGWRILAVPR